MDRGLRACERRLHATSLLVSGVTRPGGSGGGSRDVRLGFHLFAQSGDHAEPWFALGDLCRGGVLERLEAILERHQTRTASMLVIRPCFRRAHWAALRTLALRSARHASICEPGWKSFILPSALAAERRTRQSRFSRHSTSAGMPAGAPIQPSARPPAPRSLDDPSLICPTMGATADFRRRMPAAIATAGWIPRGCFLVRTVSR